jgi:hypothetical protein
LGSKINNEAKAINFPILRKCNCDCGGISVADWILTIFYFDWKFY